MMEEKFDTEFKRKVKGINPEIPDVVSMRISDTLASLPDKRSWRKFGYLSTVAALFLVCFVGIRYIYPMGLSKKEAPNTASDMAMAAKEGAGEQDNNAKANMFTTEAATDSNSDTMNKADENTTGDSTKPMLKSSPAAQSAVPEANSYGVSADLGGLAVTAGLNTGTTAEDKGIQLILKTAIYDGKEIRVEFDKSSTSGEVITARATKENTTTTNSNSNSLVKSAGVNVAKQYEVRVVVNDIPLKCSINVIETPIGENQYSGTMIIVPDSGLPDDFNMILNFDKIGEISGQWLLTTKVLKQ